MRKCAKLEDSEDESMPDDGAHSPSPWQEMKDGVTDDPWALRAILASAPSGDDAGIDGPLIHIISAVTEDDAFKQNFTALPDSPPLEDDERVPVSQFGAALLRGMGWKQGHKHCTYCHVSIFVCCELVLMGLHVRKAAKMRSTLCLRSTRG